ncbi:MAG TPA: hypothetical protein EYP46_01455, partial [Hadesarchaea archaeon]|nr:hypothetical protein [Hadesarchaea archaeon]
MGVHNLISWTDKYPTRTVRVMRMEKITTLTIRETKDRGERVVMVATYDYTTASMVDEAGIDAV